MHCYSCGIEREPVEPVAGGSRARWQRLGSCDGSVARAVLRRARPSDAVAADVERPYLPIRPSSFPCPSPHLSPHLSPRWSRRVRRRPRNPRSVLVFPGVLVRQRNPPPRRICRAPFLPSPRWSVLRPNPRLRPDGARGRGGGIARAQRPRTRRRPRSPAAPAAATELSVAAHMAAAPPTVIAPAASAPIAIAPAASEPATDLPQATPAIAPGVCPYLGFKDDPATQCSYPDDRNVCHAASARASSLANPRRPSAASVAAGGFADQRGPSGQLCA